METQLKSNRGSKVRNAGQSRGFVQKTSAPATPLSRGSSTDVRGSSRRQILPLITTVTVGTLGFVNLATNGGLLRTVRRQNARAALHRRPALWANLRKSESGQVVVLATAAIFLIIGFAALVVDVGFLYATRRNMQTAADAAAIAGANALNNGQPDATSSAAAQDVASLNGYTNGANNVNVTVGSPNPAPSPTDGTYVQVTVSQPVPTFFMGALGYSTVNVSASAVAGFVRTSNCIISLGGGDLNNALVASGGSVVDVPNCNVAVDSTSSSGLVVSGGSTLTADSIGVAASSESQASSGVTPAYVVNSAPVEDPLASVAEPTVGACTSSTSTGHGYTSTGGDTISQGTYCGGITVSGGKTLNLNPGTYILLGGGLQVNGSSNLIGSGVTFFNTVWMSGDPSADDVGNANQYNPIVFSGGSSTDLTAPTSGTFSGILFFQDRNLPSSDLNQQNTVSGGSSAVLQGDIYFSTTPLVFSGGSSSNPEDVTLVAYTLTFSGGSTYIGGTSGPTETTGITSTKLYE
jgi:Flp pilus assembly protein TadG